MTTAPPRPYLKPLPDMSEANRPFWEGLGRREFLVPRCDRCGDYNWVPYPACRSCLSEEQTWTPVSGEAEVYSFTIVHRGHGQFNDEAPYAIVMAKLVEEPRPCIVLGNTRGIANEDLFVGMPLRIVYEDVPGEDVTLWRFGPR
ncbi:MAG TPA: OB-fold domain-containing protein [Acidimicrobiales bacterium]|nr:OB-fold domain-containing protein [Acidimicrobiales bacterium]